MKVFCSLALLLFSEVLCAQNALFGKRMLSNGDDSGHIRDVAGAPDRVDTVPAEPDAPGMEIWTYKSRERVVTIFIVADKIVQIQEKKLDGKG
jgi:hypothetical protein